MERAIGLKFIAVMTGGFLALVVAVPVELDVVTANFAALPGIGGVE